MEREAELPQRSARGERVTLAGKVGRAAGIEVRFTVVRPADGYKAKSLARDVM
jgi:hypothetical protein